MKKIIFSLCLVFFLTLTLISAAAPNIQVTLLNQDPDPVEQGEIVEARFKIENTGSESLYDVEVEILPSYPFTLYTGEAIRPIGKLRAGQTGADSIIIDYKLKVDEFAVEGDNEIELIVRTGKLDFSYTNDEFTIDIEDYDAPKIKPYLRETDILQENSKGTITIEIANIDEADIKFLQLTLLPDEGYKLLSSSNYIYLGDVDSDDLEREDFDIFVKTVKDGIVKIPILLEYENSDEKEYKEEFEITFEVYSSREIYKYGIKEKGYTPLIIFLLALGIISYFYWRRKRKNKE